MADPSKKSTPADPERAPPAQDGRPGAPIDDQTRKIRSDDAAPSGSAGADDDDPMRWQYERDQSSDSTAAEPQEVIRQAARDIESGQVDTDLRNTPGIGAERQRELLDREKARTGGDPEKKP